MAESNIIIKGTDNLSSTLKKIQANQTEYRKNVESLDGEIQRLTKNYGLLEAELTQAKKGLAEAKKAFSQTEEGAENYSDALEEVVKRQSAIKTTQRNMQEVSKALRTAERDMRSLTSTAQKMDNQLASTGTSGASGMGGLAGAVKSLAAAGLGNMLGGSIAGLAGSLVTSAFGSTTGGIVSSVAGNAVTGAAMGSILGPAGAAVGGLVGAISGAISGLTQAQEKADEVYRTYMQNIYTTAEETLQTWTSEGSGVAASREQYQISFRSLFGENSGEYIFEAIKEYAETTPFEFDPLVNVAQQLAVGFGDDPERLLGIVETLGDAASALGRSESDMAEMATALSRLENYENVTREDLEILTNRGINAYQYIADALGVETSQVYSMITNREISGEEGVRYILQGIENDYEGATGLQSQTFTGMTANLEDNWTNLENAFGEGYNAKRAEGIEYENDWFEENGERLQEEARKAGELMAEMDNEQQEQRLLAFEDMFDRIDRENEMLNNYADVFAERNLLLGDMQDDLLTQIGETMGLDAQQLAEIKNGGLTREVSNLNVYGELMEALMLGDAGYNSSEVYSAYTNEVVNVIDSVQSAPGIKTAAYNSGYYIAEELTEGIAAGLGDKLTSTISREIRNSAINTTGASPADLMSGQNAPSVKGYAVGLPYVPYDDFPALLHEGERVLTRSEAAAYDAGGGGIQIVVNGLSVREEADVSRIAQELARQIALTARSYTG